MPKRAPPCRPENWETIKYEKHLKSARVANKKNREKKRRAVAEYLATHPCVDCGESDQIVLEFDHVRGTKLMAVATMLSRCASIEKVFDEINKCEVRCANCHRKATVTRGGHTIWLTEAIG